MSHPTTEDRFEQRKRDHILLTLQDTHQSLECHDLERVKLTHLPLPELDFDEIDIKSSFCGRVLQTPFFVAGMTGGFQGAEQVNARLAKACAERGWILGVGSQRRQLEKPEQDAAFWQELQSKHLGLQLIGNLGVSQILDVTTSQFEALGESIGAMAMAIHLNPLQEVIQAEDPPRFKGALHAIERLVKESRLPVLLKETGSGWSQRMVARLPQWPLAAIDVSGTGGTHWGRIEGSRHEEGSKERHAAITFKNWGHSTLASVLAWRGRNGAPEIWASGGVRNGLDAAKLMAVGAARVGFAKPALEAALEGEKALVSWMERIEFEFKTACFCTGSIQSSLLPEALEEVL